MNPANFLWNLRNLIVGGENAVYHEKMLPLFSIVNSDGTAITATKAATVETNGLALQWPAANTDEVLLPIVLPKDYDQEGDELYLELLAEMGGSTDTPALTAEAYRKRAGEDLSSDLSPSNTGSLSDTSAWAQFDLSSNGLQGGDAVQTFIAPAAHATDAINVYGLRLRYKSVLVPYNDDDRI